MSHLLIYPIGRILSIFRLYILYHSIHSQYRICQSSKKDFILDEIHYWPHGTMRLCGVPATPPYCSLLVFKFSYFFFFFPILIWFSCCCLEAFPSSNFFKIDILEKLWMSSFRRLWPYSICSYGRQDIESRREVM